MGIDLPPLEKATIQTGPRLTDADRKAAKQAAEMADTPEFQQALEAAASPSTPPYKECTVCGRQWTLFRWRQLAWVGTMVVGPKVIGEMRNCVCGGSLTKEHDLTTPFGLLESFAVLAEMLERGHKDIVNTAKALRDMLKAIHPATRDRTP